MIQGIIVPSPFDPTRSIFAVGDPKQMAILLGMFAGVPQNDFEERYIALCKQNLVDQDQFVNVMRPRVPFMDDLLAKYDGGPARNTTLTTAGIALGPANLKRISGMGADISIWIK